MRRPAPCEQDCHDSGSPLPLTMYEPVAIEPGMMPSSPARALVAPLRVTHKSFDTVSPEVHLTRVRQSRRQTITVLLLHTMHRVNEGAGLALAKVMMHVDELGHVWDVPGHLTRGSMPVQRVSAEGSARHPLKHLTAHPFYDVRNRPHHSHSVF